MFVKETNLATGVPTEQTVGLIVLSIALLSIGVILTVGACYFGGGLPHLPSFLAHTFHIVGSSPHHLTIYIPIIVGGGVGSGILAFVIDSSRKPRPNFFTEDDMRIQKWKNIELQDWDQLDDTEKQKARALVEKSLLIRCKKNHDKERKNTVQRVDRELVVLFKNTDKEREAENEIKALELNVPHYLSNSLSLEIATLTQLPITPDQFRRAAAAIKGKIEAIEEKDAIKLLCCMASQLPKDKVAEIAAEYISDPLIHQVFSTRISHKWIKPSSELTRWQEAKKRVDADLAILENNGDRSQLNQELGELLKKQP